VNEAGIDRRSTRLRSVREALAKADLDAILVTSSANIRYLTGFSGSNALLLVSALDALLLTDFRYATQVVDEVGDSATVRIESSSLWTGLWSVLPSHHAIGRIGFESAQLMHRDFQRLLEQGQRWQWRPTLDLVETLRESKDSGEIALIREAVRIAEAALSTTVAELRPGLTEVGVAGILERALRDQGSEGFPFPTIVASGERSALPHARAENRVLEPGDLVLIDFGAVYRGYCSDITRTFVLGVPTTEQMDVYSIVLAANELSSGALRVGMTGIAADAVARDYIDDRGFGDAFGHSLGHGIGLEVHEAPRLARTSEVPLQRGAVVTIEPGIYRAGWGGVRIEDDVVLTDNGPDVLTTFARDLITID
jgi:Xaa-Pro aminopeptidase